MDSRKQKAGPVRLSLLAFFLAVWAQPDVARALVTDFTWSPTAPVMGEIVTYTLVNNNANPISSIKWEYKYSAACGVWVTAVQTTSSVAFYETRPGTWQIRLTVTYSGSFGMPTPPSPTVITKNVTIAPATDVVITSGLSTPTPLNSPITVKFKLVAGTKDCGFYVSGVAQELLINKVERTNPPSITYPANDTIWTPDDPALEFKLVGNTIEDIKNHSSGFIWSNIPFPNSWYYKVTQKFQLKYTDPCNVAQIIQLGSKRLVRERVDQNNWQITEE